MKKLFTILLLAMACSVMANDIIITLSGEKIDAKITAVTRDAITYKMPDYLDGADFTISTSELSSIIFGNGQVKVYTAPAKADEKPAAKDAGAAAGEVRKPIVFEDGEFMHDGRYITEREIWRVVGADPDCKKIQKKYNSMCISGLVIGCIGVPVILGSIYTALQGDLDGTIAVMASGCSIAVAGGIIALCAIPLRTKAIETYNSKAGYAGEIRLQYSADGIGLAYSF